MIAPPTTAPSPLTVAGEGDSRPGVDVEIVVPVFNEEAGLETSTRRLHCYLGSSFPLSWTITIADNASRDRTWDVACRLARQLDGVRAVHLREQGRGRVLKALWPASTAVVVAYMDVDLSTGLDALLPLVAPLLSGHSDLAVGSRLSPGARVLRDPKREIISRGYNRILKAAFGNDFHDAQCGFKAVRADVARCLVPLVEDDGWFFDTELLVLAEHNGLRIHEVPVDWVDDPDSRVQLANTARDDLEGIWRMLRRFAAGGGNLPAQPLPAAALAVPRPGLAGQVMRFVGIGAATAAMFAVLFLLLAHPLGPVPADVVALGLCAAVNIGANRRMTFAHRGRRRRNRHYLVAAAVAAVALVATVGALLILDLAGVSSASEDLAVVTAVNALTAAGRFLLLRRWAFRSTRPARGIRETSPREPRAQLRET